MLSYDNVRRNVRQILKEHEETRGNDNLLIFRYWSKHSETLMADIFANLLYTYPAKIMNLTNPESIRRVRQKIQEGGEWLPPDNIVMGRRQKEAEVRRFAKLDEVLEL